MDPEPTTITHAAPVRGFLSDIMVIPVVAGEVPCSDPLLEQSIEAVLNSGEPKIVFGDSDDNRVALCVPVYRDESVVSLLTLMGTTTKASIGVMEIWQPIGEYEELSLTAGFFGPLDRFQNVSSFVRFEKGSGLPGQVWRDRSFVVHDNLPSHSGFLRAAGASAESLQVAFGIPVVSNDFVASVVVISSDVTPVAKAYEVWRYRDGNFLLETKAYQHCPDGLRLELGKSFPAEGSLPGQVIEAGGAVLVDDPSIIFIGRIEVPEMDCRALAVPFYEAGQLTNVLVLIL